MQIMLININSTENQRVEYPLRVGNGCTFHWSSSNIWGVLLMSEGGTKQDVERWTDAASPVLWCGDERESAAVN